VSQDVRASLSALKPRKPRKLRERTKTGLDAARKQDRIGGRRPKLRPNQQAEIVTMVSAGSKTVADAARLFAVHPATIFDFWARAGAGTNGVKV
jgi:DNA invertase Pin-like site-specific DNA recombinase